MPSIRSIVAGLSCIAACLPASVQAQLPNLASSTYVGLEFGTGKVALNCPANVQCSRVDVGRTIRAGYRFNPAWAFEVGYSQIAADWLPVGFNQAAEFTGFAVGAAYALPLSGSLTTLLRFGGTSNEVRLQPSVPLGSSNPGRLTTRSVKPYVGLGLSWQFAQHWSTSLNADWTRADLRETASGPKQAIGVRMLGAGIAFNF
jgi:Outer membrane protein beta-barrel domain